MRFLKQPIRILPRLAGGNCIPKYSVSSKRSNRIFSLGVISNFDGRLRMILEQFGVSKFFQHICVSSELGADKPDPLIYRRALQLVGLSPNECLYAGDDPDRDWKPAVAAGLQIFRLDRKRNSLRDLFSIL